MSSPDRPDRRRLLALALAVPMLAGCSFTPLYGNGDSSATLSKGFAYAEPTNRYEQVVYQELAFRLGTDVSAEAPLVTISVSLSGRRLGRTSPGSVLTDYEMVATATMTVDSRIDQKRLLSATRFAGASYEVSGQVVADTSSAQNAGEQASRAVADTLRLLLAAARNKGDI